MSISCEHEGTSGRMIAANSLGRILTRDFWADGGVNSILTLVLSPLPGSKLPSKTVAYFMAHRGNPKSEDSARFIIHLRSLLISIGESGFDELTWVLGDMHPLFAPCLRPAYPIQSKMKSERPNICWNSYSHRILIRNAKRFILFSPRRSDLIGSIKYLVSS